jgi:DNA invertase Pin-like site-specific DNA recombinase
MKGNKREEASVAIYVRVSSKSQDTKSQERELEAWAKGREKELAWYKDKQTGTVMERPGLDRLLRDVRSRKITKVVVWRLDRLGRTARGLLELLEELQHLGVGFLSLREGFELGTPAGRLMAGVLASVAAYETEVRKERQMAGIAKAKAEGKSWGGSVAGTRRRISPDTRALVRKLKRQGKTVALIGRLVGISRKTVYSVLRGS